jgi:hypothetical protein
MDTDRSIAVKTTAKILTSFLPLRNCFINSGKRKPNGINKITLPASIRTGEAKSGLKTAILYMLRNGVRL